MKTKIVNHLAGDALDHVLAAQDEVKRMISKYPQFAFSNNPGPGLDMAVLKEKLAAAEKLVRLLT